MRIKIIKSWDCLTWYNDKIGEVFDSYREYDDSYLVRCDNGLSNIIYKRDAEILETTKEV